MAYRLGRRWLGLSLPPELYYIVHDANWSIDWDGYYITSQIQQQFGWPSHLTSVPFTLVDQLIHYGDLWSFLSGLKLYHNKLNTVVTTIFHGNRYNVPSTLIQAIDQLIETAHVPKKIVTACRVMEQRLIEWDIPQHKVVCIPLGVDTTHFLPASPEERIQRRQALGIPADAICIGSFQKDGAGWGDGLEPKLIKGPDVFVEVVKQLSQNYKVHVLLTAPARGYVKQGLDKYNIPYTHHVLAHYPDVVHYYHCLDLYLVTSRDEGGPKAILESLACGIPLVSTKVGMAPDVITHNENGLLANSDDVDALASLAAQLIESPQDRIRISQNGLAMIGAYDWGKIATRYYHELYLPLLRNR